MMPAQSERPVLRGDCAAQPRPCSWVGCRYHLGSGASESCALDVADRGDHDRAEVAVILGLSEEEVAEIEAEAFEHASELCRSVGIEPEDLALAAEAEHLAQARDLGAEVSSRRYASGRRQEVIDELLWVVESMQRAPLGACEKEHVMEQTLELAARIESAARIREREAVAKAKLVAAQAEMREVCAVKADALAQLIEDPSVVAFLTLVRDYAPPDSEPEQADQTEAGKLKGWLIAHPGRTFTRQELCAETGVSIKTAAPYLSEWTGTLVSHPGKGVWISIAVQPADEEKGAA